MLAGEPDTVIANEPPAHVNAKVVLVLPPDGTVTVLGLFGTVQPDGILDAVIVYEPAGTETTWDPFPKVVGGVIPETMNVACCPDKRPLTEMET